MAAVSVQQPSCVSKLERMVPDQREIPIEAAFRNERLWGSMADLYLFDRDDWSLLRSYIYETYLPDGRMIAQNITQPTLSAP